MAVSESDFENRVPVQHARVALVEVSIGYNPAPPGLDDAYHNAHALPIGIDSINEHLPNL